MDLPFKPHFSIHGTCGAAIAHELTPEQYTTAEKDPVDALRLLPMDDRKAFANFYKEHEKMGHEPEPRLVGIAPMPVA